MGYRRVVNFHGVGTPGREIEPGEAPYWISEDQFKWMLDLIAPVSSELNIAITFDDGNVSDLTVGLPELAQRGMIAEFFILTGRLGSAGSLDVDGVKHLLDAGMTIGSHGVDHLDLASLSPEALDNELRYSKRALDAICGYPITSLSAPFGRYDAKVLRAAKNAGYECIYSSDGGPMKPASFLRSRTSVRNDMDEQGFLHILHDNMPLLKRVRRSLGRVRRATEARLRKLK